LNSQTTARMIDLKFDRVSKKYLIRQESTKDSGRSTMGRLRDAFRRPQEFWAVNEVSFEVERGESLGIIGHNGAGKSTILKLLSHITTPTSGEITINGRLSALIEVGSGFHPELTGRENIYLSGSILGMRRGEITSKLDSIVDFAGIRQFIDTPVKRYSSGMYVRLGFSIAAHLDPDILLLDEVLAVGDAAFQAKCLQRIGELEDAGTTIVFISHDLNAVERLCDRVILMDRGRVIANGTPQAVITQYQQLAVTTASPNPRVVSVSKRAEVIGLSFEDSTRRPAVVFQTGAALTARVDFVAHEGIEDAVFDVAIYSDRHVLQCALTTTESGGRRLDLQPGRGTLEFHCPQLGLLPGAYWAEAIITRRGQPLGDYVDVQARRVRLSVEPGEEVRGNFYLPRQWRLTTSGEMCTGTAGDAAADRARGRDGASPMMTGVNDGSRDHDIPDDDPAR
jgi:ABC-type polysaccharide/polyol phosphate transport system ATPase subunit